MHCPLGQGVHPHSTPTFVTPFVSTDPFYPRDSGRVTVRQAFREYASTKHPLLHFTAPLPLINHRALGFHPDLEDSNDTFAAR